VERVSLYALQALPAGEVPAVEAQIAACAECRQELEALHPIIDLITSSKDILR